MATVHCVTCEQPLPEETEKHPSYFAQVRLAPAREDLEAHADELKAVLRYTTALWWAIETVLAQGDEIDLPAAREKVSPLLDLGEDLCKELERRCDRLYAAGKVWQQRAEGTPSQTTGGKED